MLFLEAAKVFLQIEKKSGRLEMTDLLANLFKQSSVHEIDKLIYILQGVLAPPYSGIELGMGERFAMEAIAASSGYSKLQVETNYKKTGDLGDTAEELLAKKKQTALMNTEMDMTYVYNSMTKIAKSSGSGSQEQKIKYLTEMLNNSSPIEARFLVRFVIGRLRLGIGDPTILDSLSVYKQGDKTLREALERAYNVCSDLGFVAKKFFEDPKHIDDFKVTPFKPLMPALAERLSTPEEIIEKLGKCAIEKKYDGFRLQCHKKGNEVEIYSRKLEKMTHMFPDIIDEIKELSADELIFEGEALAYDRNKNKYFPFQQTIQRRRKHNIDEASKDFPLNIFVFDILFLNGKDLTHEKYEDRRKIIENTFKTERLKPSGCEMVTNAAQIQKIFDESLSAGLEGIMAKDLQAPYTAGKRKFAWIKLKKSYGKSVDTIDVVIVGYYLGQGARVEFEFGGLLVAVYNEDKAKLQTVARIGSGFSEEEMKNLKKMLDEIKTPHPPNNLEYKLTADIWTEAKYVVEVAFDEITQSPIHTCAMHDNKGYALRFPRMVALRDDKGVGDATTSSEVVEMFNLQRTGSGESD